MSKISLIEKNVERKISRCHSMSKSDDFVLLLDIRLGPAMLSVGLILLQGEMGLNT